MRAIGFAGFSGAGKTTLIEGVIAQLRTRGLCVSTIKQAHAGFDMDRPGKDSYRHRVAGAEEVLVASGHRMVLAREFGCGPVPDLAGLLARLSPVDLVLVEGFKHERLPKIEVFRAANGKPALHPIDPEIVAIAGDTCFGSAGLPHAGLDDHAAVAALVVRFAIGMHELTLT